MWATQELSRTAIMYIQSKVFIIIAALTLDRQADGGGIIGGHEAVPHSRPYMALVEMLSTDNKISYCDGFLISQDFVMTAAHCRNKSYKVFLGVHNFNKNETMYQIIPVNDAFPHQDFKATKPPQNDLMLLKLSSKANFNNYVKPIELADHVCDSCPERCLVSGWGHCNSNTNSCRKLMEVNITLVHLDKCNKSHVYCSKGNTGPAHGDSGGPLVCEDGKAYGVISFTYQPHSNDEPIHGFARISDYREWIEQTMTHKANP
ncbi:granzyme B [Thalassophryne amazonica]|uniref:granzyme B n=1 Tax=Thalassophryne amazonica TaxID=390379 RepID=UPI0014715919|nr:granzyme B [Thalassophryne amazonica]